MVRIDRIYTRGGDNGETSLTGGARVRKASLRVRAYGDVDELNSFVGVARTLAEEQMRVLLVEQLRVVQQSLFDIGAVLSTPTEKMESPIPGPGQSDIDGLERWIDLLVEGLPELKSFVLPGGTQLNAMLLVCRSVCRRAERTTVALSVREHVPTMILVYLNRLSDLFFAMARYESAQAEVPEDLWEPGS